MAEASGEISTNQPSRTSASNSQESQSAQTTKPGEKPADGAIIDMVQTPDGKWVARDPQDPKFFYQPEAERSTGSTSTDTKPQTAPKPETKKPTREDELRYLQADGAELAALVYTPEGQRQIAEARTRLTQVVETTSGKPRLEHAQGFNRIFTSRAINQLNERIMQTWRQNIDKRVEELLRGERMTNSEDGAYLTAVLKHGPIPQETTALLAQFQQQRREIGRALLYQSSDNLPVGRRLLLANAGRLRLFGISTTQAQQSFAEGWDGVKKGINTERVENPEVKAITDRLLATEHTGTAFNTTVHEDVTFSNFGEKIANFVRFRARAGERLFLGTNHEGTEEERKFIDSYIQNLIKQGVKTAYIEQGGGLTPNNLSVWLEENDYWIKKKKETEGSELGYLAQNLRSKGIQIVNMDLAGNVSAIPYALNKFGLERTVRAINWELSFRSEPIANLINPKPLDRNKIPEIIAKLITQAGGQITSAEIASMISGRDIMSNDDHFFGDNFSNSEREEYMASLIKDEKIAIAAHTAHTTALLDRIYGNQSVDDLNVQIDSEKIERVIAETKKRGQSTTQTTNHG